MKLEKEGFLSLSLRMGLDCILRERIKASQNRGNVLRLKNANSETKPNVDNSNKNNDAKLKLVSVSIVTR